VPSRKQRVVGGLLALLIGTLLALGAVEGILRLFPHLIASDSLKREQRWRRTHVFVTRAPDNPFVHSPELGWDLRPGVRHDGLTTNSAGLRGRAEYAPKPQAGVRRVLVVGDSFMFGEKLRDEEALPAQLETALNRHGRWEVLNLGVPGYGTDQQWLRLQQLGFRYTADVVVLGFFEDDARRNIMYFRDYAKPFFELTGGQLALRNVPVPSPEELLTRPTSGLPCRLRIACAAELIEDGLAFDWQVLAADRVPAGRVTLAILDAMRGAVLSRGMQLVLMTIPRPILPQPTTTEDLLVQWAKRTRTPILNTRQAYLAMPESDRKRLYAGHWTPYGAAVTAGLLAERISEGPKPAQALTPAPGESRGVR
jgi:hypothetical protein